MKEMAKEGKYPTSTKGELYADIKAGKRGMEEVAAVGRGER